MSIQHSVITDPNIHEPKGAAAAVNGQIYVANGTGSGTWKQIIRPYSGTPTGDVTIDATSSAYVTYTLTPLIGSAPASENDLPISILVLVGVASTYVIGTSAINSSGNLVVNIANLSAAEINAPIGILVHVLSLY